MEVSKLLELTGQGFTIEQIGQLKDYKQEDIKALLEGGQTPEQVISFLPYMDKVVTNDVSVTQDVTSTSDKDKPASTEVEALKTEIAQLKATIQASNLKNVGQPQDKVKTETATDVIMSFFDKPKKED